MNHLDISFVVLHYLVSEQTKKCIDSIIKNVDSKNYLIVVVDNYSNNGTLEEIKDYIKNKEKIEIIENANNLGFAQGNNAGINYINNNYDCDFICVLNNDVYLQTKNIYESINQEFQISNFAVAGPKIYTKDGKSTSNPVRKEIFSYKNIKHRQIEINIYYLLYKLYLGKIVQILENRKNKTPVPKLTQDNNKKYYNVQLHGCFYIFSKTYFNYFKGFDDRTFLYMEEEILYQHLINHQLVSVYLPHIEVFHEEDASTNAMLKKRPRNRQLFVLKHHKKSIKVLLYVMKNR